MNHSTYMLIKFSSLAIMIVNIIATWKMFEKANEEGWKAIIPVYNRYTASKIGKYQNLFWVSFGFNISATIIFIIICTYIFYGTLMLLSVPNYGSVITPIWIIIISLLLVVILIGSLILRIIINIKFVSCYTEEMVFKVFAGIGALLPIAYTIVISILGLNAKYEVIEKEEKSSI